MVKSRNINYEKRIEFKKFICPFYDWNQISNQNLFIWFVSISTVKFFGLSINQIWKNVDESLKILNSNESLQMETMHLFGMLNSKSRKFIEIL